MLVYRSWILDDKHLCMTFIIPAESWDALGWAWQSWLEL